jgi:hypothetical protein
MLCYAILYAFEIKEMMLVLTNNVSGFIELYEGTLDICYGMFWKWLI